MVRLALCPRIQGKIETDPNIDPYWGTGFLKIRDPQVTIGFYGKSWSSMTWMFWGEPHDMGNLVVIHDLDVLRGAP